MQYEIWHNPKATPQTTLAIADGGLLLANPTPSELDQARRAIEEGRSPAGEMSDNTLFVSTDNLFRLVAESGSSVLGLSYRHQGVKIGSFTFAQPHERDRAVHCLEQELGLRKSTKESSGSWAQALKPALYLLAVVMITIGLAGALGDGGNIDANGVTAAKANLLINLAERLGPAGVWAVGGILSAVFLFQTIARLKPSGPKTILEPAPATG